MGDVGLWLIFVVAAVFGVVVAALLCSADEDPWGSVMRPGPGTEGESEPEAGAQPLPAICPPPAAPSAPAATRAEGLSLGRQQLPGTRGKRADSEEETRGGVAVKNNPRGSCGEHGCGHVNGAQGMGHGFVFVGGRFVELSQLVELHAIIPHGWLS